MEKILPKVKGSQSVVAKSHARFLATHKCRHCKEEFYPKKPRKIFLCEVCEEIPESVRRRAINERSLLKRKGRIIRHRDGTETMPDRILKGEDVAKEICDSPLGGCDRSSVSGALKYWRERPWHFSDIWNVPATDRNIRAMVSSIVTG
jgi:hypothetical protein